MFNALFSPDSETNLLAPTKYPSVDEVIEEIHGAGGIAILAHPYKYGNMPELEKYIELGLDGVEVWCPTSTDENVEEAVKLCKKHKLLMTGGSDFHGLYGRQTVTIGSYVTPDEQLDKLMGYKAKEKRAARRAEKLAAENEQ